MQEDFIKIEQMIKANVERMRGLEHKLEFSNPFSAAHIRDGKLLAVYSGFNGVTIAGKNHAMDVVFGAASPVTQVDPWYIGLVNNSPAPVFAEADTLASHAGWAEFSSYTGNRKEWDDADSSAKVKGSTAVSSFTMSGAGTINGIFIASVDTGTSGILWATGSFDAAVAVISSDVLKVAYGVRM